GTTYVPRSGYRGSDLVPWPFSSVREAARDGRVNRTTPQYGDLGGVVLDRRPSLSCRLARATGCDIIVPRRKSIAHLHRPWRATRRHVQTGDIGNETYLRHG